MKLALSLIAALSLLGLVACFSPGESAAGNDAELRSFQRTIWTPSSELFVEYPTLISGEEAPFTVHLTTLKDSLPVGEGTVTVSLLGGSGAEERFQAGPAPVKGIFRPVARPLGAGKRSLKLALSSPGLTDNYDLGEVTVFPSLKEALAAQEPQPEGKDAGISYLKEQQWKTEFATAPVEVKRLQKSVPVFGTLRARDGGESRVVAPAAGILQAEGTQFPTLGSEVRKGQVLARLSPKPQGSDPAAIEQAEAGARAGFEFAQGERERLDDLFEKGAIPERRALDARRAETQARAELDAAERRLLYYRPRSSHREVGLSLRSSVAGTLVEVLAKPDSSVEGGDLLFRVVALDRLWLDAKVPESEAAAATLSGGAWFDAPGHAAPFHLPPTARIGASGAVHPESRTVTVLYALDNPGRILAEGLAVRAHIFTGQEVEAPAVPVIALVEEAGQQLLFVQTGGESFERRVVNIGIRSGIYCQVLDGVSVGERVVTRGAYSVKLAASSAQLPAHGHAH